MSVYKSILQETKREREKKSPQRKREKRGKKELTVERRSTTNAAEIDMVLIMIKREINRSKKI